ncbi:phosphotransferase enzyme family protein [Cohnella thailandensis]|uniref:Phosphotransferase n=1 Tax=Cohnella thailandensis TaxID=557557 RepID=A0A841SZD7_9BACL|nr:phosphotransferase [Cohnella thailandensis]MBB6635595.1 phosphotransferase [Cohnella thailandensis]MBP1974975.1 homoserine kinase type II [Cohnella thailandensis]
MNDDNRTTKTWAEEISAHLKDRFGLKVLEAFPIDKGWINVKWRMMTDDGPRFVKFYHPDRYKLHLRPERRSAMENTLRLQQGLHSNGVPSPQVYLHEGKALQQTRSGLIYTLQGWADGATLEAGAFNCAQMADLGEAAGRMHRWLAQVPPADKPAWQPDKAAYLEEWKNNWRKAAEAGDQTVLGWLERSRARVAAMDFSLFENSPTGWLHWDLWSDNLLFRDQRLAGIVDYDRMAMAYPEIDVARAILSGALQRGELRSDAVQAFMEGYRAHHPAPPGMVSRAIRMLYLIESIWWLRADVRQESELTGLLRRFIEEIQWIEEHMDELAEMLDGE